jgi:hypothetical protein
MNHSQVIVTEELREVLDIAIEQNISTVVSYLTKGKWHMATANPCLYTDTTIHLELSPDQNTGPVDIQIDQPLGLSMQIGRDKHIFESIVLGLEPVVNEEKKGKVVIRMPRSMEKMQRRAYNRVAVPNSLRVAALFWHRGYTDNSTQVPMESYWQGEVTDLSAGGIQIAVDIAMGGCFKDQQLIGLQFTPMPYEKPIVLEGKIQHVAAIDGTDSLQLGIEFVGLEASADGREKLRRIVQTIDQYRISEVQKETQAMAFADEQVDEIAGPTTESTNSNVSKMAEEF